MACAAVVGGRSQEAYGDTQMIRRLMDDREVVMYVDLHGHSRKKNIFMYGCENKGNWHLALHERVFPRMLWRNGTTFSYADCNFKVQKAKESTARVVVWRELGLTNRCGCRTPAVPAVHRNVSLWRAFPLCRIPSYTLEASFAGVDFGSMKGLHFTKQAFMEMGHVFCDTILDYCDPDQVKVSNTLNELRKVTNDSDSESVGSGTGSDSDSGRRGGVPSKRGGRRGRTKGSGTGGGAKRSKARSRSAKGPRGMKGRSKSSRPLRVRCSLLWLAHRAHCLLHGGGLALPPRLHAGPAPRTKSGKSRSSKEPAAVAGAGRSSGRSAGNSSAGSTPTARAPASANGSTESPRRRVRFVHSHASPLHAHCCSPVLCCVVLRMRTWLCCSHHDTVPATAPTTPQARATHQD